MRLRSIFLTVCVLAVIVMMAADASAQSNKIYGYVKYNGLLTNGITVTLLGDGISGQKAAVTSNNPGNNDPGYYEFVIENGSNMHFTLNTSNGGRSAQYSFISTGMDKEVDLTIPNATVTSTPTLTPTPRPSDELGGLITRNDSSSFIPMSANGPTVPASPKPSRMPTAGPTIAPTPTPRPTQAPAPGIFSNIYLWLVVALVAILAIAAATLYLLRR